MLGLCSRGFSLGSPARATLVTEGGGVCGVERVGIEKGIDAGPLGCCSLGFCTTEGLARFRPSKFGCSSHVTGIPNTSLDAIGVTRGNGSTFCLLGSQSQDHQDRRSDCPDGEGVEGIVFGLLRSCGEKNLWGVAPGILEDEPGSERAYARAFPIPLRSLADCP